MKLFLFHAEAGYGHKKVAQVARQALLHEGAHESDVRLFDALDFTPSFFKKLYPATYQYAVQNVPRVWGWFYENLDVPQIYRFIRPFRELHNQLIAGDLLRFVQKESPDVIICTHFLSAQLFSKAKRENRLKAKVIVIITDFFPHTFWQNEGTDLYWVMCKATEQELIRRGVNAEKIIAGGIPVDPKFIPQGRREAVLKTYGLSPNRFTLLLTSGSFGLGPQIEILRVLAAIGDKIQCWVVCGNNKEMQITLDSMQFSFPVKTFGFIDFMPDLMEASDIIVAKTGGSTTTESLAKGVPMVILEPIPGQETRNAKLMLESGAAFAMKQPSELITILRQVLGQPELLISKRAAVKALAKPNAAEEFAKMVLKGGR